MTSAPQIIVCDWLPPAFGAVGQYELPRAEAAAAAGRETVLIGLGMEAVEERVDDGAAPLTVRRLAARPAPKNRFFARAFWTIGVVWRLFAAMRRAAAEQPAAEIKVTGSPPFFAYLALAWARFARRKIAYRITDFYPETAFAAGKLGGLKPFAPLFHLLRRRAGRIEALSRCQRRRLLDSGVDPERIALVRDGSPVTLNGAQPARRPFEPGDVVLLYSGNLGVAHDWRSFAQGYANHVASGGRTRLWLNAHGVGLAGLCAFCDARGLPYHVSGPAPLSAYARVMLAADAHLILLGDAFWGFVFPSKVYATLASGRPAVFVGPRDCDVHRLLVEDGGARGAAHQSVRQGRPDDVAQALDALAAPVACAAPLQAVGDASS